MRYLRARENGFSTDGLETPFAYVLRRIAKEWGVPPPFMKDWFSYQDIREELAFMQCEAEAKPRR